MEYLQENEKYKFYVPNGKAEEFIKAVGEDKTFIILFSAANGVGKTSVGANILANIFWESVPVEYEGEVYNFWDYPLYKEFPYEKRGRIVSDPTTVQGTLIPELKKWFPAGRYKTEKRGKNYEYWWKTDTGFKFDVMTYDQDDKEFESANLGWAWFDEPPTESIFKATVARMRTGGIIFITATPLTNSAWLYDQIMTKQKEGQRKVITATVWDNSKSKGVRGRLDDRDIERMIAEYDEEDKHARIFGKFQHLTGLVFKSFSRDIHVIKPFDINYRDYVVYERLDPHPRNPHAVLWVAVDKNGTYYAIDELYLEATTGELAQKIKSKAALYRIQNRKIDPMAFIEDQRTNTSMAKDLQAYGLHYIAASKARSAAIQKIKDVLHYNEIKGQIIRPPQLYIFESCTRLIWEMEHWQYQEWTGKTAERRGRSERPQDKDDHMIENLGRVVVDNSGWVEPPEVQRSMVASTPTIDPF